LKAGIILRNRGCWHSALWGRVLVFFFLATCIAEAEPPSQSPDLNNVLGFFYKDPRPERLTGFFASMQSQFPNWDAYPPAAGLFAGVFSLHPDWIERLTSNAPDPKAASTLIAALRLSGQPAKAELLRTKFTASGLDAKLETEFAGLPGRIEDLRITTPTHLDIFWGASFATGDGRYVRPIIDFMAETADISELIAIDVAKIAIGMGGGPKDVLAGLKEKYGEAQARKLIYAGVALWATRSNATQHEYVKQAIAGYIAGHPGTPATKALSALTGVK
jgi:hypothetical protein